MATALSREARIVFLTAAGPQGDAGIAALSDEDLSWEKAVALASAHKCAAALCRSLQRLQSPMPPAAVLRQLERQKMVADFHSQHLRQRMLHTLQCLQLRNVETMLLKGAALGVSVYPSFVERPMADVDLLIRPADVPAGLAALREAGWVATDHGSRNAFYEQHHHLPPMKDARGSGHAMELHVKPFPPPNPFGDVAEDMWRNAEPTPVQFCGAVIPSRAHMLVYACVHFAWSHRMNKGVWRTIRDIAALSAKDVDWNDVAETAQQWRAASSCYWTLRIAERLASVEVPAEILERLRPPMPGSVANMLERHLLAAAIPGERPPCPSERASEIMWRAAIRPRWSGHVPEDSHQPAQNWFTSGEMRTVEELKARQRPSLRLRAWWQYLGAVCAQ
jgi:hypothetical protein